MSLSQKEKDEKFIQIYKSYVDEIYHYIYLRVGLSQSLAEDLTQEIFINVYQSLSSFQNFSSDRTWLYQIAKNKLSDFYRKQYRNKFEHIDFESLTDEQLIDTSFDIQENLLHTFEQEKRKRNCKDTWKIKKIY